MNCPLQAKRCGGCSRLSVPYQKQLMYKQEKVKKLFACATPIIGMKEPVHYRNKVISAFSHDRSGLISGMYAFGTHYVLPVDSCLLENARADEIICELRRILAAHGVRAYDENSKKGLIRFAVVRYAQKTKQGLVTIVTARQEFPCGAEIAQELNLACPDVRTVVQNVNDRAGSAVMGFRETVLFGEGRIEDELCGLTLQLSSRAFYQVNSPQTEKLYQAAINMAQVSREDHVLDAYCGIGVIGLLAAKRADRVTGIELNADAVHLAIENAAKNKIDNTEFIQGDTARVMEKLDRPFSIAFLDPPRAGCDEAFLRSLCAVAPKKICYIACDIMTQARDAQYLKSHGYSLIAAQPVDMFPHTDHIENICLFER